MQSIIRMDEVGRDPQPAVADLSLVEVICALSANEVLRASVRLQPGMTVAAAIEASQLALQLPGIDLSACPLGIFHRLVARDREVLAGDRIEIYRPLTVDPKEARRLRVACRSRQQRTPGRARLRGSES